MAAFVAIPRLTGIVDLTSWRMAVWFLGPCLLIYLRRADPDELGLCLGDWRRGLWLFAGWTLVTALGLWLLWWLRSDVPPLRGEGFGENLLQHLLNAALPEEIFFRAYLQTRLQQAWPPQRSLFGARLGWGWLLASLAFACAHLIDFSHPLQLLKFFPGLAFGYLRARTGSILAPTLYHGFCNALAFATWAPFG